MTISRLLNEATTRLKQAQIEDPALEAGLILSWAIKKPRAFIYAHSDMGLNPSDVRRFMELVERRSLGEPFQYITGECEFMSLKFKVNPNVLIPEATPSFWLKQRSSPELSPALHRPACFRYPDRA